MIPLYLDEYYEACTRPTADGYILVGADDRCVTDKYQLTVGRMVAYRFDHQIVKAVRFETSKYVLHYSKFFDLDKFTEHTCQAIGGVLTGNLSNWFKKGALNSSYDDVYMLNNYDELVIKGFKYKYKLMNKLREKITQFHHLHVRLVDIYCKKELVLLTGYEAILAMYLDRFSDVESTHSTFLVYYHSLPEKERDLFIQIMLSYGLIDNEWLKAEGIMSKQSQHGTKYDLSKLFELNVLVNRVTTEINWAEEKTHRINPTCVPILEGDVYRSAKRLFYDGLLEGRKPLNMSWRDYWGQRGVIMPSGAVHSRYADDCEIIKELPRAAKNKKGFSSCLGDVDHSFFINRAPEITAHTSTKYEWGKTRALYGCDYTSHVNADFGLLNCEDTFPGYIPTGASATPKNVKRQMESMTGVPLCYDYDDFNSQHSKGSMKAVIRAWQDVYAHLITEEQHDSVEWTIASIDNMYVDNYITKDQYESNGTLYSGWRLTSFINTALNYVYLENNGLRNSTYKSVHNGDDMYGSAKSLGHALELIQRAEINGVRAQKSKMNIGTIAEFLRTDMRAKEKTSVQYLTRGCATFVHSRIESEAPLSLRNIVEAYYNRHKELMERGAMKKIIDKCYRKQLYFSRSLFNVEKNITDALVEYDVCCGGVVINGKITDKKIKEVVVETITSDVDRIKTLTRKGVQSYTRFLKNKFPTIAKAFSYQAVERNTVSMYNMCKKTCIIEEIDINTVINEKALRHAWANLPGVNVIHKVRMGVSDIVLAMSSVSHAMADVLVKSGDPIKWMKILL